MSDPLTGFRILELGAIGPVPFTGALLADMGADVVRIDRIAAPLAGHGVTPCYDFYNRNKRSLALDLKRAEAAAIVLDLAGRDACLAPVLSIDEAPQHPHMKARAAYAEFDGLRHPSPAPRFSKTQSVLARPTPAAGQHSAEVLQDWRLRQKKWQWQARPAPCRICRAARRCVH
jgi:crotonobetainyl-CoA:carnitine CoA-transferase CaiB-like acyl-CoA transferase